MIEVTIDFSKLSRQQMRDLLKSCSREDRLNLSSDDNDYEEEDSFDPDTAEDPSRCWMMKQILRAFNHSRIDPTREEAMETVKQMYDYMGWK